MDKYRYHIYPDRIYVFEIAPKVTIELRGWEIANLLGIGSYLDTEDN